jgi:hypothetical protein
MNLNEKNVFIDVHEKALIQALNAEVKRRNGEKASLSLNALLSRSLCNADTGPSVTADDAFQISTCIFTDAEGQYLHFVKELDCDPSKAQYQPVHLDGDAMMQLDATMSIMNHRWMLRRANGEEWICNLEDKRGYSRLLFSAAMHYLIDKGFKLINDNELLSVERRTKRIAAGDWVEFYLIRVVLYPHYQYSRGKAYCRKVRVDFTTNSVSSGPVEELEIKDLDRERDIEFSDLDYSQDYDLQYDNDDYDIEEEEYSHEREL